MKKSRILLVFFLCIILIGCQSNELKVEPSDEQVRQEETTKETSESESEQKEELDDTDQNTEEDVVQDQLSDRKTFEAQVVSVTDGDTIKVKINGKVEAVRFLLVDTPETNHPRLGEQPFGQQAKSFTKQLLEGKTVQLEKDVSDRDKYGRLLYYLYVDGKSVQEELLRNGLARVAYVYAPNTKYVDQYYAIQKEAQAKGVGIWSVENYAQEDGFHEEVVEGEQEQPKSENQPTGDCTIKGNISSKGDKIYHMPGQQYYDVTKIDTSKGEKFFCSRAEAEEAGFRPSQR